jgi:glutamate--cysteine ligase catalytic subunit
VTYSKDDPKILLSLRQADILEALASDQALTKARCCTNGSDSQ